MNWLEVDNCRKKPTEDPIRIERNGQVVHTIEKDECGIGPDGYDIRLKPPKVSEDIVFDAEVANNFACFCNVKGYDKLIYFDEGTTFDRVVVPQWVTYFLCECYHVHELVVHQNIKYIVCLRDTHIVNFQELIRNGTSIHMLHPIVNENKRLMVPDCYSDLKKGDMSTLDSIESEAQ